MRLLAVVQARSGSTRLPGKVLAEVGGTPMLAFMLRRLRLLNVDELIVATSDLPTDNQVAEIAGAAGVSVARGSESDVLARFLTALESHPSDAVVRLTADCPLIDPRVVEATISRHFQMQADYTSNTFARTFPQGLDAEVVSREALERAFREAKDPVEREHVTPFIYRRPQTFKLADYRQDEVWGHERWTVDTADDLAFIRQVVGRIGGNYDAGWEEVLDVAGPWNPRPQIEPLTRRRVTAALTLVRTPLVQALTGTQEMADWTRIISGALDDPAVRVWVIPDGVAVRACLAVAVDDGAAELHIVLRNDDSRLLRAALSELQSELRRDRQVSALRAHDIPRANRTTFADLGFAQAADGAFEWCPWVTTSPGDVRER